MLYKFFEENQAFDLLGEPLLAIFQRDMRLKESFCPSNQYVAKAASHDTSARNLIQICLKLTKLGTCCECCLSQYWQEKCD